MAVAAGVTTSLAALGIWVAVFPGTLERVFGLEYLFLDHWGVLRLRFEVFTLATLAALTIIAVAGYLQGRTVRTASPAPD